MKTHFLIPVLLAAIGAGWLVFQTSEITSLEKQNADLAKRIAARASRPDAATPDRPANSREANASQAKSKDRPDWKAIAAQLAEAQNGAMGDMRAWIRNQQRIQAMSTGELIQAIEDILALDLPEQSSLMLEQMVAGVLILKDPELALETFSGRINEPDGVWSWTLSNALKGWAQKDLQAATAWFDLQVAEGKLATKSLDGSNRSRDSFEGSLLSVLLSADPAEASRRIRETPENRRAALLSHYEFLNLKEKDQPAYADLVRQTLPEDQQAQTLSNPAGRFASESYAKAAEYLDRIHATPAERAAAVEKAAETRISTLSHMQKVDTPQIDELRTWADSQSPGSADKATGKALSQLAGINDAGAFRKAADLALQYHAKGSGDDLLVTFLDTWQARTNKEAAAELAQKISDPVRREDILKKLR